MTFWLERNDCVFNDIRWSQQKVNQKIWLEIIDSRRIVWDLVKKYLAKNLHQAKFLDSRFCRRWCNKGVISTFDDTISKVTWLLTRPITDYSLVVT